MGTYHIPVGDVQGISVYKYPLGSGNNYNYIPIFIVNLSQKASVYMSLGDEFTLPISIPYSDYNFSAIMWGFEHKNDYLAQQGSFGNYEDKHIKITVNEMSDTKINISVSTIKNNEYLCGYSATHGTSVGFTFACQLYVLALRDSDGKVFVRNKNITKISSNPTQKIFENTILPSVGAKGSISQEAFIGQNYYDANALFTFFSTDVSDLADMIKGLKPWNPDDPYENAGDEPDDPGQGEFDYGSDDVPVPDLPKTNVTDSGLVSLFAPDEGQLRELAKFLWSDSFSLDSFKKIFNNPMDCILGLSILPIHLPHGSAKEITVGNIVSTVSCDVCNEQYVKLNCGSFTFSRSRFTGGYLDNAPYTRCYLYLPFIGTQEINIDEFMGATLGVEYHIDILTGAMFCFVTRNSKLLLTYSGNCAENVPLSANDFTSTISSMLSMATVGAGAIATIATAGATAPTTAGMASEALGARTASSLVGAGAQGASAVMNSKPNVQHSGSLGGGAGAMGQLYPYLIFIAPRPDIPTDQNMYTGFPSNDIVQIGNLKDFNVIEAVNLEVKGANDTEMSEIEAILKGGVII